ncbi:unnamed protein product [Discosporangium mesarthrocarpum]
MSARSFPLGRPVVAFSSSQPFAPWGKSTSLTPTSSAPQHPFLGGVRRTAVSTSSLRTHLFIYSTRMMSAMSEQDPTTAISFVPEKLEAVRKRVADATASSERSRPPRLVAVSKTKPLSDLVAAYEAGQRVFGENYAQELIEKAPAMPEDVVWHFIGHLQSNKARALVEGVPNLSILETLDTAKLANKLQARVEMLGWREAPLGVYIQVDTSGEASKSGVSHDDTGACVALGRHVRDNCPALELRGLMTIGAVGDIECFDRLVACRQRLADGLGMKGEDGGGLELSMGMSGDFEEAIQRGSDNVRVGSTIFGPRHYPNKG